MNARISETFQQENYFNILITFIVSKNLSFKLQIKSTMLKSIT